MGTVIGMIEIFGSQGATGAGGVPGMGEEDGATVLGRLGDGQRAMGGTVGDGEPVDDPWVA